MKLEKIGKLLGANIYIEIPEKYILWRQEEKFVKTTKRVLGDALSAYYPSTSDKEFDDEVFENLTK